MTLSPIAGRPRPLPPFSGPDVKCTKCAAQTVDANFQTAAYGRGRMVRTCQTCHVSWSEAPADEAITSTRTPSTTTTRKDNEMSKGPTTTTCPKCHKRTCQASLKKLDGAREHLKASCVCGYAVNTIQDVDAPSARSSTAPTRATAPKPMVAAKPLAAKVAASGNTSTTTAKTTMSSDEAGMCDRMKVAPQDFIDTTEAGKLRMSTRQFRQLRDAGVDPAKIARERDDKAAAKARERARASLRRLGIDEGKLDTVEV